MFQAVRFPSLLCSLNWGIFLFKLRSHFHREETRKADYCKYLWAHLRCVFLFVSMSLEMSTSLFHFLVFPFSPGNVWWSRLPEGSLPHLY